MNKQFCSSCGNQITESGKFCNACGHPLVASTENMHASSTQQATPNTAQHVPAAQPSKKRNNPLLYVIIAAVVLVGVFFWIKDTPEDVAKQFVSHVMSLEFEKAEKLLSPDADSFIKEEFRDMRRGMAEMPIELSGGLKVKHRIEVEDVTTSGSSATVDVEIFFLDDEYSDYGSLELKKHGIKWKVVSAD